MESNPEDKTIETHNQTTTIENKEEFQEKEITKDEDKLKPDLNCKIIC